MHGASVLRRFNDEGRNYKNLNVIGVFDISLLFLPYAGLGLILSIHLAHVILTILSQFATGFRTLQKAMIKLDRTKLRKISLLLSTCANNQKRF